MGQTALSSARNGHASELPHLHRFERLALMNPVAEIGWGANAQLAEVAVQASPEGRTVLSKAWNRPKVGDPQFQHPAMGAARSAAPP
eukprot:2676006-Alexandrium_andersonii.AAC.1